jgi:methionyl-tRNA synthetase
MSTQQEIENTAATAAAKPSEEKKYISIDDFSKIDLRVAKILKAEHVEGAEKLLRLELDVGEEKPRQIFAGIKAGFTPEQLVGKSTVIVANLEPRKMRFGLSEGMMVVASDENGLWLVNPEGAKPGSKVK